MPSLMSPFTSSKSNWYLKKHGHLKKKHFSKHHRHNNRNFKIIQKKTTEQTKLPKWYHSTSASTVSLSRFAGWNWAPRADWRQRDHTATRQSWSCGKRHATLVVSTKIPLEYLPTRVEVFMAIGTPRVLGSVYGCQVHPSAKLQMWRPKPIELLRKVLITNYSPGKDACASR